MKMGWYQDNRIKSNVIHVRLKDGKIWSQLPSIKRSTAGDVGLYLNSTAIPRT
ncbi:MULTISPECIES: element excision factor XisI family protein, partial [unclassified Microcoleus]|uniref:element excision factor XisI family protein n=1 Tax=unclassified Microcoleus TaxID=2642155 RepID=UPI002FCF774D